MKKYKEFLSVICDIDNLSVKEIMEITGKSQPVVYSWMNLSKEDCFPSIESLTKILFRLGLSFDDFINCRHPVYDDLNDKKSARIYYQYYCGVYDNKYIDTDILDLLNSEEVLKAYIFDRMHVMSMINDYVDGLNIDTQRFDLLCKALMPYIVSEVVGDGDEFVEQLNSYSLQYYKEGLEAIKELEEEHAEDEEPYDAPSHRIYFPFANHVILLAAENSISLLNSFLSVADECEKRRLLPCYLDICAQTPGYDKKNKILKKLIENNCEFYDDGKITAVERYRELLRKILQIKK